MHTAISIVTKNNKSEVIDLNGRLVGDKHPTYFIAEIGNNHNGDFYLAKRSIEAAAAAGAHAVKFQKRSIPDTFARELRDRPQTEGVIKGRSYGEYRQELELDFHQFSDLQQIASELGITFFATPFDFPSLEFLEKLEVPYYKIASFDVTNLPLIRAIAKTSKPIVLSTGMASAEEVKTAVDHIQQVHSDIILLHCVSVYPSPDSTINLSGMQWLKQNFTPLHVGYSGHEPDILPSLVAIAQGAKVVERHFTLSKSLNGPDHATVSIEPDEFKEMVQASGRIHLMQGKHAKSVLPEEQKTRDKHSKSLVSAVNIPKGTRISEEMLVCKSPGYGLKPGDINILVGRVALKDIDIDTVLRLEDFGT